MAHRATGALENQGGKMTRKPKGSQLRVRLGTVCLDATTGSFLPFDHVILSEVKIPVSNIQLDESNSSNIGCIQAKEKREGTLFHFAFVGRRNLPLFFMGSFGWSNNQIDVRQINRRKTNLILYVQKPPNI